MLIMDYLPYIIHNKLNKSGIWNKCLHRAKKCIHHNLFKWLNIIFFINIIKWALKWYREQKKKCIKMGTLNCITIIIY